MFVAHRGRTEEVVVHAVRYYTNQQYLAEAGFVVMSET